MSQVHKVYVDVMEYRKKDGSLKPQQLIWRDGRIFAITHSEYKGYSSCRAGGGKHYVIWVKGQKKDLYLEKDRWFVEAVVKETFHDPLAGLDAELGAV